MSPEEVAGPSEFVHRSELDTALARIENLEDEVALLEAEKVHDRQVFKACSNAEFHQRTELKQLREERDALKLKLEQLQARHAPMHNGKRACAGCGQLVESLEAHALLGYPGAKRTI